MIYCKECGFQNDGDSMFCTNCGVKFSADTPATPAGTPSQGHQQSPPNYQQQPGYQQQPPVQAQPGYPPAQGHQQSYYPQQHGFFPQPQGYIRPPDYQFTKTAGERIGGTLKANIHVVEEIEERKDLQSEANKIFIASLAIIALFRIISLYVSPIWIVYSYPISIVEIILETFVNGYLFVYLCAVIGQRIGGHGTQVDRDEILRVLSYAYIAKAIEQTLYVVDDLYSNFFTVILWIVSWIYALYIVGFALTRALDKGWGTTIGTVIIVSIIIAIVDTVLYVLIAMILGSSYV